MTLGNDVMLTEEDKIGVLSFVLFLGFLCLVVGQVLTLAWIRDVKRIYLQPQERTQDIGICSISAFSDKQNGYEGNMNLTEGDVSISQDLFYNGILDIGECVKIDGAFYKERGIKK